MNLFRLILWSVCFAATASSGCKIKRKSLKNNSGDDAKDLIYTDTVTFTRATDNRSGTLKFKARIEIHCAIEYWQRDNANNPLKKDCDNTKPRSEVVEVVNPLQSNSLYTFRVSIWLPNLSRDSAKTFLVDEGGDTKDYVVDELVIAKANLPLQTIEVYRHQLDSPTNILSLQSRLAPEPGCKAEVFTTPQPFERAEESLDVKYLSTQGFAAGSAKTHPEYANRLLIALDKPQPSSSWEWAFEWRGAQFDFISPPPSLMAKLILNLGEEVRFSDRSLAGQPKQFNIPATDVKATWEIKNPAVATFLALALKGRATKHVVSCIFNGNDSEGIIPANLIQQMPSDEYDFRASFVMYQFHIRDNSSFPAWLIASHDWRFAKLIKP